MEHVRKEAPFSLAWEPRRWELAALNSDIIDADEIHPDVNSLATSPSHDTVLNPPLSGILDAPAIRDQNVLIWSPVTQRHAVNTAYSHYGNGWNTASFTAPPAREPISQEFAPRPGSVTQGFGQSFNSAPSLFNYPLVPANATAINQPDHFLQLPNSGVNNGFGAMTSAVTNGQPDAFFQLRDNGVYNNFGAVPNGSIDLNSFAQGNDVTVINSHPAVPIFNELSFPAIPGMSNTLAWPAHDATMLTAHDVQPVVRPLVASRVASRNSNVNTAPYICDYSGCGEPFRRRGDFLRHKQKHDIPHLPCPVQGCIRRGSRAFYRIDKLRDHLRNKHRMAV